MATISMKDASKGCPYCGEKVETLYRRSREDARTGKRLFAGEYYGCAKDCRALTLSPDTGKFNLAER